MVKRQMELGLADGADIRRRASSATPSSRATWWFEQMRQAVENPFYQMPPPRRLRRRQSPVDGRRDARATQLQTGIISDEDQRAAA